MYTTDNLCVSGGKPNYFLFVYVCYCRYLRACLYQGSVSTLRQYRDDASNTVLIEHNGATPEWGCNPFLSDSIVSNENIIASIIT